ncbi:host attachment family protein [Sphingomonas sp. HF-S4]|uniref:Host attachment family protein n=1 Tax=Sphingomonas agrestis TaxID=3080540 RepID=A0ABU3Y5J4_9SPHN|nr:host attachment family protein [Sphingomonas sp. HF-S4]MDV3456617.1 host attachment family protein [Sphingomonas sp. HF-S4]
MQVPHDTVVVVADGRKMLFLRNEGDAVHPNLQVEKKVVDKHNPAHSEQATDLAGGASSTRGGGQWGGGNMAEVDFHQQEEDRFAADTAELLKKRALANDFESLIIIAPPKTLGELRKHYHKEVSDRLKAEIAKDLTDHTVPQIEEALARAE